LKRLPLQVAACAIAFALVAPAGAHARPDRVEQAITGMVNYLRAANGLQALAYSGHLARVAGRHSRTMARRNTLVHSALSSRRGTRGQTLAWMPRGTRRIARRVVRAWMRSPSHRAALLSGHFRRIGVSRARGRSGTFVTAELFGR
jgi:uncharacterized protein YkwD